MYYRLVGTETFPCDESDWHKKGVNLTQSVAHDTILRGALSVSTVFLCIDHNHLMVGSPVLFETMVFEEQGNPFNGFVDGIETRYSTYAQAVSGHKQRVFGLNQAVLIDTSK